MATAEEGYMAHLQGTAKSLMKILASLPELGQLLFTFSRINCYFDGRTGDSERQNTIGTLLAVYLCSPSVTILTCSAFSNY